MRKKILGFSTSVFRTIAYMSCTLQWLWLILLVLPIILESNALNFFLPSHQPDVQEPTNITRESSLLMLIVAGAVTIVMVVISIVALIRMPGAISKQGSKLTQNTSKAIIPVITHHKKLTA